MLCPQPSFVTYVQANFRSVKRRLPHSESESATESATDKETGNWPNPLIIQEPLFFCALICFLWRPQSYVHNLHLYLCSSYCRSDKLSQSHSESATGNWIGNRQLNRQLVGNCPSNPLNTSIGQLSFSKVSMLCSQPSFILTLKLLSFRSMFYISVRIGNRQLNRHLASSGPPNPSIISFVHWSAF